MIKDFTHPTLGTISITHRPSARHIIMRIKQQRVFVTVHPLVSKQELLEVLSMHEQELLAKMVHKTVPMLDHTTHIRGELFGLQIALHKKEGFLLSMKMGQLIIYCPEKTDFKLADTQSLLVNGTLKALKYEARRVLPDKVEAFARKNNISVANIKVNSSKGRWGSCSNQRNINLSCYCLLLPPHLLDYVILHELTHTFEMNHSERFYAKLNQLCGSHGDSCRMELKRFSSPLLNILKSL